LTLLGDSKNIQSVKIVPTTYKGFASEDLDLFRWGNIKQKLRTILVAVEVTTVWPYRYLINLILINSIEIIFG